MRNVSGQVAGPIALITIYDLTSASKALVNAEMALIKAQGVNFVESLAKLSKENNRKIQIRYNKKEKSYTPKKRFVHRNF